MLLFIVVGTTLMAALLSRYGNQILTVQRQVEGYQNHHASKGIQECVSAWMVAGTGQSMRDMLDREGRAFTLELDGGARMEVFFREAQDTLLAEFAGLSRNELHLAAGSVDRLREIAGGRAAGMIRKEGPLQVSVVSAPREVLEAIAQSVAGDTSGSEVASELLRLRNEPKPTPARLLEALTNTKVSPSERTELLAMLTVDPVLWKVRARVRTPDGRVALYEGLALVQTAAARARAATTGVQRSSAFLAWGPIEPDTPWQTTPGSPASQAPEGR